MVILKHYSVLFCTLEYILTVSLLKTWFMVSACFRVAIACKVLATPISQRGTSKTMDVYRYILQVCRKEQNNWEFKTNSKCKLVPQQSINKEWPIIHPSPSHPTRPVNFCHKFLPNFCVQLCAFCFCSKEEFDIKISAHL